MKSLILAAVTFFSVSIFAQGLGLEAVIQSPVVIISPYVGDAAVQSEPWIQNGIKVTNESSETITIAVFEVKAISQEGVERVSYFPTLVEELVPGQSFVQSMIMELPDSSSMVHNVTVRALGWIGPKNNPTEALEASTSFLTQ